VARKGSRKPDQQPKPEDLDRDDQLFIQEVNEELKQEKYTKLWKQYGRYFVGAAVVVILGVAGWQYWQSEQRAAVEAVSVKYAAALRAAEAGKNAEASKLLTSVASESDGGYAALARLQRAALFAKTGEIKAAAQEYRRLADDQKAPKVFRELGTVMWGLSALDTAPPKEAIDRLKPLTADTSAWRYSARELTALFTDRAGRRKEAIAMLDRLAKDTKAPDTIRSRAREMVAILGES
jgi:hypothetical protein